MATVDEVRELLRSSNQVLGQSLTQSITATVMSQVNLLLDTKLKLAEDKLMASISELASRTEQLERTMDEGKDEEEEGRRTRRRTEGGSSASGSTRCSSASANVRGQHCEPCCRVDDGLPG